MAHPVGAVAGPGVGRWHEGSAFVPGFERKHEAFCDEVVLKEHPLRDGVISCWCLDMEQAVH